MPGIIKEISDFNFSEEEKNVEFSEALHHGLYTDYLTGAQIKFDQQKTLTLKPWGYKIYVKK